MSSPNEDLRIAIADRYTIESELGQGGMAMVYLAHDVKHNRKVALKVLRPELAAVIGAERFLKEIEVTANLQHPNILPLFDSGRAGGGKGGGTESLYYVMPYIEGETLREKLARETQLSVEEAVAITRAVAGALDYAHRHDVIHRDIKPENVLLHDGNPMVADFGIALAVSHAGGTRLTETGLSMGTPHYMSPEQALGERELDARSDVYSLGAMLHEMLAGEPPFTGPTAQSIVAKVITEKPPMLTTKRDTVPRHVAVAVFKALAKLPADRYPSAMAFGEALVRPRVADTDAFPMPPEQRTTPADQGWRRLQLPLLGLLVVAVAVALWGWLRPAPQHVAPRARFYHIPDSSHSLAALCCGPLHAVTRDGTRFAYLGQAQGRAQVYVREIDELDARPIPGTRAGVNLFFSPDGEWLGFVGAARTLYKVALAGGIPIPVLQLDGEPYGATWTDRNTIVYATSASPALWSVSADGGTPQAISWPDTAAGAAYRLPHYVPDADALVFTVWMASDRIEDARVGLQRLDASDVTIVARGSHPQVTASGYLLVALPGGAGGAVVAQRFDVRSGRTSGSLEYLAEDVFLSRSGWSDFAVSLSGMLLYRVGGFNPVMDLVRRDGSARSLPLRMDDAGHFDAPRFSPDGRRLAFAASMSGGHRVHVLDLERGTVLRLTLEGNTEHFAWTDDGDSVILAKNYAQLVVQAADRSGEERLIMSERDAGEEPSAGWSLSRVSVVGPWVAFGRETDETHEDILILRRDSDEPAREYVATRFNEYSPAIAPSGRWLAYVSDETGRDEIYVSSFPEPGGRQSLSTEGGSEPVWARDGRTLFYRNAIGNLVSVTVRDGQGGLVVEGAETLPIRGYELSPDGVDYDVSPGGDDFAMIQGRTGGSRLVLMLNALVGIQQQ